MWPARVSCRLGQHVNKNIYLRRSGKIKIQNWFMESFPFSIQSRPASHSYFKDVQKAFESQVGILHFLH